VSPVRRLRTLLCFLVVSIVSAGALAGNASAVTPEARSGSAGVAGGQPARIHGVVQGGYHRPWTHLQRMRFLEFLARTDPFNAYVHGPKWDPYQGHAWRIPYPEWALSQFRTEIAYAHSQGIEWIPTISPGHNPKSEPPGGSNLPPSEPMCFSCPEDFAVLEAKLEPFWQAGVRTFKVSFDDAVANFTHPWDFEAYGEGPKAYGRANADLLNRLLARLRERDPSARLLTVGARYHGTEDRPYLAGLREKLDPSIEVMWVGPDNEPCCGTSPYPASALLPVQPLIGRRPFIWENWVNNDRAGGNERRIYLGPYQRDPAYLDVTRGLVFNAMNEPDLNMLPLATAAEWLRDPYGYVPHQAWSRAITRLAGPKKGRWLRAWAETSASTRLDQDGAAPTFHRLANDLLAAGRRADWVQRRDALARELQLVIDARRELSSVRSLAAFRLQAAPYFRSAERAATAGLAGADLIAALHPSIEVRRTADGLIAEIAAPDPAQVVRARGSVRSQAATIRADGRATYGNRRPIPGNPIPEVIPRNKMDLFLERALEASTEWSRKDATRASRAVTAILDGRRLRLDRDGRVKLGRNACGKRLVATDAAGSATAINVRCNRRASGNAPRSPAGR
jgi:hyaluronoglucosaminidase